MPKAKNLHLLLSAVIVIPVACAYGLFPDKVLPHFFDFELKTTDLKNVFRAIMGLYLGISSLWILGMVKPDFWGMATLVNMVFMGSLAFGRILSILFDGIPSTPFMVGTCGELILAIFAFVQFKKFKGP